MRKFIGIILLVLFVIGIISYLKSNTFFNRPAIAIGEFIPIGIIGFLGAYLTFKKK